MVIGVKDLNGGMAIWFRIQDGCCYHGKTQVEMCKNVKIDSSWWIKGSRQNAWCDTMYFLKARILKDVKTRAVTRHVKHKPKSKKTTFSSYYICFVCFVLQVRKL